MPATRCAAGSTATIRACRGPNGRVAWRRFGAAGRDAPVLGLGLDSGKELDLARAARRKEEDYAYKRSASGGSGNVGTGRNAGTIEGPGDPNKGMGASSHDIGRSSGNDNRGALKIPF